MLIVLIVLSLAIPLAQAVNFFVGVLYDTVLLLIAASRSTEEELEAAAEAATGGGGGGGQKSAAVQQAKAEKKKADEKKEKKKEAKQAKRLASVFSRSRNKGKSGAGPSGGGAGGNSGNGDNPDKPAEWPNKPATELATQRDVNMAVASLRRAVAGLMAKDEVNNRRQFDILTKTLYDLRFIRYESLRAFTIKELAKIAVDLERLRNIEVAGLRNYATEAIADVRGLIAELQRQNGGGGRGGAVLSRRNGPPSTNPFDASAARSGVFGALAARAQSWLRGPTRPTYDEISPASDDDDYDPLGDQDATSDPGSAHSRSDATIVHHVFYDVDSAVEERGNTSTHEPSASEREAMQRLGGMLPPV